MSLAIAAVLSGGPQSVSAQLTPAEAPEQSPPLWVADPAELRPLVGVASDAMRRGDEPPISVWPSVTRVFGVSEPSAPGADDAIVHQGDIHVTAEEIVVQGDIAVTGSVVLVASRKVVLFGTVRGGDGTAERPDGGGVFIVAPEIWLFGEQRVLGGDGYSWTGPGADGNAPADGPVADGAAAATALGKAFGPAQAPRGGDGGSVLLFGTLRADGHLQIAGGHGGHGAHAPADPRVACGADPRGVYGGAAQPVAGGDGGHGGHAIASGLDDLLSPGLTRPAHTGQHAGFRPMPTGEPLPHLERHHRGARGSPGIDALAGHGGDGGQGSDGQHAEVAEGARWPALPEGDGGDAGDGGTAVAGSGSPGLDGESAWKTSRRGLTYASGGRGPDGTPNRGGSGGPGGGAISGPGGNGGDGGDAPPVRPGDPPRLTGPKDGSAGVRGHARGGNGGRAGFPSGNGGMGGFAHAVGDAAHGVGRRDLPPRPATHPDRTAALDELRDRVRAWYDRRTR